MTVTGPTFIALQVRELERAADFYETKLGLVRAPVAPPGAVVFDTAPASFAVREPLPGVDLDAARPHPGVGVALWLHADDAQALHDALAADGIQITLAPFDGPFGRTFTFSDLDGYDVTIHDKP
ncbi:VOC family protein [uncultured Jatrophihabitans sp.]|uniref:VOC family protein n=1 Tax=uncultured Jatrophihabitans sp. TaxID=1610747 RepID=UPI0035CC1C93